LGAAFGAVVTSLVDDVLMQIVGLIFGQPSFNDISIHWGDRIDAPAGGRPGVSKFYENQIFIGSFVTAIINFLIIAFVIFMVVKAVNKVRRPKEVVVVEETGPTEVELLTQIRDALARG
jgi:large conductance mechanosensitive channel